jgi:uncharacterized protein (DUF427 family)
VKAIWNNAVLAESATTEFVEGHHYFPPEALHRGYFKESSTHSVCGRKGTASYYDIIVKGQENKDAAWYYPAPLPEAKRIAGFVAFCAGVRIEPEDPGAAEKARRGLERSIEQARHDDEQARAVTRREDERAAEVRRREDERAAETTRKEDRRAADKTRQEDQRVAEESRRNEQKR